MSLSDFVVLLKRDVTIEEVNQVFKDAAAKPFYQGILDVTEEELVSTDFRGNSHSSIVDLPLTNVVGGNLVKVVAWYDNEWGYSNRLVELVADVGRLLRHEAVAGGDMESHHDDNPAQPEQESSEIAHDDENDGAMGELDLHQSPASEEPASEESASMPEQSPDEPQADKPLDMPDELPEASDEQKALHEERQSAQW